MKRKHILLVDDNVGFTQILTLNLELRDYEVTVVHSGQEALEKVKNKPDLILLDIDLPDMNGHRVCDKIRQDVTTHHIPIVMVTASDTPEGKIEGLYIGADDYIIKPFDTEELFARIEAVLRRTTPFEEREKNRMTTIQEIKKIIDEKLIAPHFQPIFYLHPRRLLGVEVLSRPPATSSFKNTEDLFDSAFHLGMLFDLEMVCHKKALVELKELVKKNIVSFNVSPYLIQDAKFKEFASLYKDYTEPQMIILELTERTPIKDFPTFSETLKLFKDDGFKLAIDDLGSGYASLNSIVEIKPDFIKIDTHIIRDIQTDRVRQNLFKAIMEFCKQSDIITIAEGIESSKELDVITEFGVDAVQGYLLGRPTPKISDIYSI